LELPEKEEERRKKFQNHEKSAIKEKQKFLSNGQRQEERREGVGRGVSSIKLGTQEERAC